MDDATQRLVDEARHTQGYSEGDLRSLVRSLADALEAAQRPPVSPEVREEIRAVVGEQLTKAGLNLNGPPYSDDGETQWPVALELRDRLTAAILARFSVPSRPPVSPEVESLEQELFKHQPVLSMRDGSVAGCQCSDRVFHKRTEDWGTHLAEVFVALSLPSQQHVGDWDADRAEYVCSCGSALNAWWPDGMTVSGGESAFDKWMRLHPALPPPPLWLLCGAGN